MLRPKILVFIDWFLPGYKAGGPIRSCINMMNHLDDHEFFVVCGDRDYMDIKPYDGIDVDKWHPLSPNIKVKYLPIEKQIKETYQDLFKDRYDHIYINGIYSKRFSILPLQVARNFSYPITVSVRGMLKDSAIAVKKIKKTLFLRYARYTGLYKNVIFHVTNNLEKIDVEKRISKNAITMVAPNLPKKVVFQGNVAPNKAVGTIRIVSLARIAPEKNLLFALQTLSKVDRKVKVDFDIYGSKYDKNYWIQCDTIISNLAENVSVNYKGVLHPDDIEKTIQQYNLMFLPTRGENYGHVIIESLISGIPVLISDQTPWNHLEEVGVGYVKPLTDQRAFVEVINHLSMKDQKWMNQINKACFSFAKKYTEDPDAIALNKNLFLPHA